jgi:hypothetical protein
MYHVSVWKGFIRSRYLIVPMTGSVVEYIVILVFLTANIRGTSMLELKTSECVNLATTVILAVQSAWELSHPVSN